MSTSQLGRAKDLDKYWSKELTNQFEDQIQIESVHRKHIQALPEISEYPYPSQLCLSGEFRFGIPGRKKSIIYKEGKYEYRTASGLFLLDTPSDRPTAKEVFSEINKRVSGAAEIKNSLSLDRGTLWRFLEKAESIEKLVVRGPEGTYDAVVLADLLQHDNPQQALKDDTGFREDVNRQSLESLLDRIEIPEEIEDIRDLDIDWYNTVIDHAEATFWYGNDQVTFEYNRGVLKVKDTQGAVGLKISEEPKGISPREYVLQLFESEVIYPSTV